MCGAARRPGGRYCVQCGLALPPDEPAYPVQRVWPAGQPPAFVLSPVSAAVTTGAYPLRYAVAYPGRQNRLGALLRPLLLVPHYVVLYAFGIAVGITSIVAWFAILFSGRYPRDLWSFGLLYLRWLANVLTSAALLRDEYPPFSDSGYPVQLSLSYPGRSNRLTVFFRYLLALPALIALYAVLLVWTVVWLIAWLAIVVTGVHPDGLWRFGQGAARWYLRVQAYMLLLTDVYPPFSLGIEETPETGTLERV